MALGLGFVVSLIYMFGGKARKSSNFAFTLVILPPIVAIVIMLVGSDVARAFSLAGVFALVRFRSIPGDSKDIASIFFAMAVGLMAGMGFITYAAIATVLIGLVCIILLKTGFGSIKNIGKELKITVPENLNYEGVFTPIFEKFTNGAKIKKVKTTNMGTLFELTYSVNLKGDVSEKEFIDELRCRNGNLKIAIYDPADKNEVL